MPTDDDKYAGAGNIDRNTLELLGIDKREVSIARSLVSKYDKMAHYSTVLRTTGNCLQTLAVLCGILVPLLIMMQDTEPELRNAFKYIAVVLSLVVSMIMAIEKYWQFGSRSTAVKMLIISVEREHRQFESLCGPYQGHSQHSGDAFKKYAQTISGLFDECDQALATNSQMKVSAPEASGLPRVEPSGWFSPGPMHLQQQQQQHVQFPPQPMQFAQPPHVQQTQQTQQQRPPQQQQPLPVHHPHAVAQVHPVPDNQWKEIPVDSGPLPQGDPGQVQASSQVPLVSQMQQQSNGMNGAPAGSAPAQVPLPSTSPRARESQGDVKMARTNSKDKSMV